MKGIKSSELRRKCPVCNCKMNYCFNAVVLCKHKVSYYNCSSCGLIQTEEPYWLDEAYSSAVTDLDVGLIQRNISLSTVIRDIIKRYFNAQGKFLDFAGGYGVLVRLMRDHGFDFYRYDKYCENIFAKHFEVLSLRDHPLKFELVTAIEVFEHIYDPVLELNNIFEVTDSVFLTTELIPQNILNVDDWWYFVPECGQHITFFTKLSLVKLAEILSVNLFSDGCSYHCLSKISFRKFSFKMQERQTRFEKLMKILKCHKQSTERSISSCTNVSTNLDYNLIKNRIRNSEN